VSYFKAPEALSGKTSTRSDIYSLGALLYLLLTGTPPDESTLRHRRRLRTPREINSRISQHVDDCVMRALAVEPEGRYPNVAAFLTALEDARANQPPRKAFPPPVHMPEIPLSDVETVRIVPLSQKDVQRWRAAGEERSGQKEQAEKTVRASQSLPALRALPPTSTLSSPVEAEPPGTPGALPTTPLPGRVDQKPTRPMSAARRNPITPPPLPDEPRPSWPRRITHILPTSKPDEAPVKRGSARRKSATKKAAPAPIPVQSEGELSLLKQIQRLLLGQQQRAIAAAAIIETPMRVRPDQPYNLRLHIMGRDEPAPPLDAHSGTAPAGLSALVHGETALVEVRSVLQQGYTYILQQASVTIPASGYAAEVTIPMQQQATTPTGRRDRLHIFFLDEQRNPLYEKPFVVEVFISPLVQFGREGHQVLTIPL
jgi:hypothetical protein